MSVRERLGTQQPRILQATKFLKLMSILVQTHQCDRELRWKMTLYCDKWRSLNVSMIFNLIFMAFGALLIEHDQYASLWHREWIRRVKKKKIALWNTTRHDRLLLYVSIRSKLYQSINDSRRQRQCHLYRKKNVCLRVCLSQHVIAWQCEHQLSQQHNRTASASCVQFRF